MMRAVWKLALYSFVVIGVAGAFGTAIPLLVALGHRALLASGFGHWASMAISLGAAAGSMGAAMFVGAAVWETIQLSRRAPGGKSLEEIIEAAHRRERLRVIFGSDSPPRVRPPQRRPGGNNGG